MHDFEVILKTTAAADECLKRCDALLEKFKNEKDPVQKQRYREQLDVETKNFSTIIERGLDAADTLLFGT